MKKVIVSSILALLVMAGTALKAQNRGDDYLGLPGDNLNLYAVMNLFQESATLEDFEKSLNDENSRINNLDLNNDNYVDYIMVTDYPDGNVHNIVLQVAMGPNEKQDVAVFTVQRFNDGSAQIQLIGDEALYGRNYIVEPIYDETPNPGYTGRRARNRDNYVRTTYFEVATWPMIQFIYEPYYSPWRSTWHWGLYPVYWHAWTPFYWHYYYGYQQNYFPMYYSHYRHWSTPRYSGYNDFYYHHIRSYSPTVVVNINKGHYKETYSRPQSRRDGEAMYSRTHSERSSNYSSGNRSSRRSDEVSNSRINNSGSANGRRSSSSSERISTNRNQVERSNPASSRRQSSPSTQREISSRSTQTSSDRSYRMQPTRSIQSTSDRSNGNQPSRSIQSSSDRSFRTQPMQRNTSIEQRSGSSVSRSASPAGDQNYSRRSSSSAPAVQRSEKSSGSVAASRSASRPETSVKRESRSVSRSESKPSSSESSSSRRSSSDSENGRSSRR